MSELPHSLLLDLLSRPGPLLLVGIHLIEINQNEANLNGGSLSEADLHHASLQRAELSGADLTDADLSPADLAKAFLREPNLVWANLSGGIIDKLQLSQTSMPNGTLHACDQLTPSRQIRRYLPRR